MSVIKCDISTCKKQLKCNNVHKGSYNLNNKKFSNYYMYPDDIKCVKYDDTWYYMKKELLTIKMLRSNIVDTKILNQNEQTTLNDLETEL